MAPDILHALSQQLTEIPVPSYGVHDLEWSFSSAIPLHRVLRLCCLNEPFAQLLATLMALSESTQSRYASPQTWIRVYFLSHALPIYWPWLPPILRTQLVPFLRNFPDQHLGVTFVDPTVPLDRPRLDLSALGFLELQRWSRTDQLAWLRHRITPHRPTRPSYETCLFVSQLTERDFAELGPQPLCVTPLWLLSPACPQSWVHPILRTLRTRTAEQLWHTYYGLPFRASIPLQHVPTSLPRAVSWLQLCAVLTEGPTDWAPGTHYPLPDQVHATLLKITLHHLPLPTTHARLIPWVTQWQHGGTFPGYSLKNNPSSLD